MSNKKRLLTAGLTALGLSSGFAASRAADPVPVPVAVLPGPAAPSASATPTPSVLLLSNGHVLSGYLAEDENGYVLKQRGGKIAFPKNKVEKIFRTVREVYEFKRDRLPARDPDEGMKLVHWCLTNHLQAEAREQLKAVLALGPHNAQAKLMLENMAAADDRALFRDPAVQRAGAEMVVESPRDRAVGRASNREFAGVGLPVIFDLSPVLAARRADEYARTIHPILQTHCVRCHNERYTGTFQLLQIQTKHDLTPTVLRANLEATLRLIDGESPARSDLLSSGLVPHGANKRPIFASPADPSYQRIAAWVNSLRPARPGSDPANGRFETSRGAGPEEAFAASRGRGAGTATGDPLPLPLPFTPTPPGPRLPSGETIERAHPEIPPNLDFPASPLEDGPRPRLETEAPEPGIATPPKPKKPVKIDPALLEKALQNRLGPQ